MKFLFNEKFDAFVISIEKIARGLITYSYVIEFCMLLLADITQRRLHLSTEEQAVAQAVVQSAVEQSNIAQSSNNDETQFFSSGTIPDSGQEALGVMPSIQHVSIVSASQAEPSSIVSNDEELSQAVAPPQSQQILSIEHVRMSEMIAHTVSQVEDITARNPLETQPVIIGKL